MANREKERNAVRSIYRQYLPEAEEVLYEAAGDVNLHDELRVARLTVARLLGSGDADKVGRMLLVVAKLVAEERKTSGDQASGIIAGLTQVLNEFGLGEQ